MITHLRCDITSINFGVIIHGTNCSGGFGSGVAGSIKKKWPIVATSYHSLKKDKNTLGSIQIVELTQEILYVVNCFTQINYGRTGRFAEPSAIESCLYKVVEFSKQKELPIYSSKIGCGLGGLDWNDDVEPIFKKLSNELQTNFTICEL